MIKDNHAAAATPSAAAGETTAEYGDQLRALFTQLQQLPAERRQEFLERVCAGRDSLRAELEDLLAEDARAEDDGFLAPPDSLGHLAHRLRVGLAAATGTKPEDQLIGRRLGPYEICDFIASGGMGSVYRAARVDDFRQVVALKLIRGGLATSELFRRFAVERQVLADLNHPNIARLLDGGATPENWPYFVMEFIDGQPIHRFCDQQQKSVAERVRLVQAVCGAVQYAHERGVIHRDIKPANVLVTAAGIPKLTDFGLAKQLDVESGETQTGQVLGTPNYMAPEQAKGHTSAVGPATDVYALGAILYELLVGRPPFKGATLPETLEQVCTQDPVPPRRLQPKLPRDVETICLKCLEKDPAKRYAGVAELGEDLRRFLGGEPITARPISRGERLLRWCRRNKRVASLLAALVIVIAGSIVGLANLWLLAEARGDQAVAEKNKATRQRDRARELLGELTRVAEGKLAVEPGMQRVQLHVLQVALKHYQELAQEPETAADPELRTKTAQAHHFVARLYERLGDLDQSETCMRLAVPIWEKLAEEAPDNPRYLLSLHGCYDHLAILLWHRRRAAGEEARALALQSADELVRRFPEEPILQDILASELNVQAVNSLAKNDLTAAKQNIHRAIDVASRLVAQNPQRLFFTSQLASCLRTSARVFEADDDLKNAETDYQRALKLMIQLGNPAHPVPELDPVTRKVDIPVEIAGLHVQLARVIQYRGRPDEALRHLKDALGILEKHVEQFPTRYHFNLHHCHARRQYAEHLLTAGDRPQARAEHARTVECLKKLRTDFPEQQADSNDQLIAALCQFPAEWLDVHKRDLEDARRRIGAAPTPAQRSFLGMACYRLGEWGASIEHLQPGVAGQDSAAGFFLAMAYERIGEHAKAEKSYRSAVHSLGRQRDLSLLRLRDEAMALLKQAE